MNESRGIAFESANSIKSIQEERLKSLLQYLKDKSPFYQNHFVQHKIDIHTIAKLDDLRLIPTTSKNDIQESNWDFVCVNKSEIAEYTCTSGSSGKPVIVPLTANDLNRLAYNEASSLKCAGATTGDVFQLMLTLDRLFMAGTAYYHGIRELGATAIRVGPGLPQLQIEHISTLKPTFLIAVPSFILKLLDFAKTINIDLNTSSVKNIICIGENIRDENFHLNVLGKAITDRWHIKLISTYASTEMQTAFCECTNGRGGHLLPDLLIAEVLDDDGNPVSEGVTGELTITTLGVEAMPLLRYRTGDLVRMYNNQCTCGRTTTRISPVLGRKNQMIKLKGTTLFPEAIYAVLSGIKEIQDYVVEVSANQYETDEIVIYVSVTSREHERLDLKLKEVFQSQLRIVPEITIVSQTDILAMQQLITGRKTNRFLDKR